MKRIHSFFQENPVWTKVLLFSLTLFFLRTADAIIAFWAPNQIESALNSSMWMGLVISFQSVIGFIADLTFPSLLRTIKVRKLVYWSILLSALTSLLLLGSAYFPFVALLLVTMTAWGIYYELLNFAQYQFIGEAVPSQLHSGAWGISGIFSSLAYFLGPLIATWVLLKGYVVTEVVFIGILVIGLLVLALSKSHQSKESINVINLNPILELKHWLTLAKVIWPLVVMSILLGFMDSAFWTIGAIWTQKLAKVSPLGAMFLPIYQFPSIFLGLVVARWGIYRGKKVLTEKFLIVAGLFLVSLAFNSSIVWQLTMVLFAASALAVCYPLLEGIYTDLIARMGHEKKDMIGLTNSVTNIAYIIGPPVAGFISLEIGERLTFSYLGLLVILTALGLLFVTPKKLRLPQGEIKTWDIQNIT